LRKVHGVLFILLSLFLHTFIKQRQHTHDRVDVASGHIFDSVESHSVSLSLSLSPSLSHTYANTIALKLITTTTGPRRIQVSITVQSVEKVSTQDETCEVGMLLDVYWLPSREELASAEKDGDKVRSTFNFEGNFQTVNAIQDNERDVRKKPRLVESKRNSGHKLWYAQLWISSCFKQQFQLRRYILSLFFPQPT
jgi:hypothetical protein